MAIIRLTNTYVVYKITNIEALTFLFVKEYKTKGEAAEWIYKEGERNESYFIQEIFKK